MAVNALKQESYSDLEFFEDRPFTKQPSNSGVREEEKYNMIESFGSPLIVQVSKQKKSSFPEPELQFEPSPVRPALDP